MHHEVKALELFANHAIDCFDLCVVLDIAGHQQWRTRELPCQVAHEALHPLNVGEHQLGARLVRGLSNCPGNTAMIRYAIDDPGLPSHRGHTSLTPHTTPPLP